MSSRPSKDQWDAARQRWESEGTLTHADVAKMLNVSRPAVSQRAKAEGWQKLGGLAYIAERAQRKADERRLTRESYKVSPKTVEAAIDLRADLLDRHRADWAGHRARFPLAALSGGDDTVKDDGEVVKAPPNFELAKVAKITAEMIKIRQDGERKAYGLDDIGPPPGASIAEALADLGSRLPG